MTINALLLICIAYLSVKIFYKPISANSYKDNVFSEIKKVPSNQIQATATKPLKNSYKKIKDRNLFNISMEEKDSALQPNLMVPTKNLSLEPTKLKLILWGTIIGTINTYAVIEDKQIKVQALYKIGDMIQGAVIKEILRDRVLLRYDNQDYILESNLLQTPEIQKTITKKSNESNVLEILLKKSTIRSLLNNIDDLKRQINIKPVLNNGKSEGLMVYRIRSNSLFYNLGLRNGDVIKQVNGNPITSTEDTLQIYQKLKDTEQFNVLLLRKGAKKELVYQITPDEGSN